MSYLVVVIALLEGVLVALFGAFALAGDSWGIARAMALGLSMPFASLTLPALVLLHRDWPRAATLMAVLSVPVTWAVWALA